MGKNAARAVLENSCSRHHQLDCGLLLADSLDTCAIASCSWFPRKLKFSLPAWSSVCTTRQHLTQSSQLLSATQHVTWLQMPSGHVWSPCHHLLSSGSCCWPVRWVCSSSLCSFSWSLPVVLTPWWSDFSPTPDQPLLFPSNLLYFCLTDLLTFAQILAMSFLSPDLTLLWLLGMTHFDHKTGSDSTDFTWHQDETWQIHAHIPCFISQAPSCPVTHTSCWSETE